MNGSLREQPHRVVFGVASILLHMAALAGLIAFVRASAPPRPLDELAVEMVFEPAEEPKPPDMVAEFPPLQPQVAEAEPTPPEPPPAQAVEIERPPPEPPTQTKIVPEPSPSEPPKTHPKAVARLPAPRPPTAVQTAPRYDPPKPTPSPSVASPVTTAPPVGPAAMDPGWQASVAGWLAARKTYPEEARRRGEEGRVVIRFTVDRTGRVLEAAVAGSSGSERLDAATVTLLRNAALPAFPPSMQQGHITITTSVRYTLR